MYIDSWNGLSKTGFVSVELFSLMTITIQLKTELYFWAFKDSDCNCTWCCWQRYVGDFIMMTVNGDSFMMSVTILSCRLLFSSCWWLLQYKESVNNISKLSSTSMKPLELTFWYELAKVASNFLSYTTK